MYRNNDPMKAYMQEIGVIPLISKKEEIELARRIKLGDNKANQKLIKVEVTYSSLLRRDFAL